VPGLVGTTGPAERLAQAQHDAVILVLSLSVLTYAAVLPACNL
jgi:hypothetical protein